MRPRRPARSLGKGGGRRAFPSRPHIVLLKDGLSPRPAGHFWTCSEKCAKGCPRWSTAKGNALDQVREIFAALFARTGFVLGTPRIGRHAAAVQSEAPKPRCTIRSAACSHWERRRRPINRDRAAVVWAGPSDEPVAQEAVGTLEAFGHPVVTVKDAGVSGLHRVLSPRDHAPTRLVVIVVAGMEGALPSVVGGLVEQPVIAVPTSVGYGATSAGLAALSGMLNSCAAGVASSTSTTASAPRCAASLIARKVFA